MLYQIFALTVKDLKILFRDRGGMITLFAMPIMFILVMSVALQNAYQTGTRDHPIDLLVVNQDRGAEYLDGSEIHLASEALAALSHVEGLRLIEKVEGVSLTQEKAETLVADGKYPLALIFPPDFSLRTVSTVQRPDAPPPSVTVIVDPTASTSVVAPVEAAARAVINRTVAYAQAPFRIQQALADAMRRVSPQQGVLMSQAGDALIARLIETYDLGKVGGEQEVDLQEKVPAALHIEKLPDAVEQNVPGYTVFGVFFIVSILAGSILQEKEEGTFRRLMVAPLPRAPLLLGKLLPYYLVNLIQVTLMFAIGRLVFGMSLGHDLLALALVSLATSAAATGLGLLVAALGRTRQQISGLSTLLALLLAAVGGALVPVFVMPDFMQALAHISPHYWALRGYQDVIVRGLGTQAILPEVGVLLGFALVFYSVAVTRFRFT